MIEFISYTGKWPNLCRGVLTVKIDGKEIKFGHDPMQYEYKTNSYLDEDKNNHNYDEFWCSGGYIEKDEHYHMEAIKEEWKLNENKYSEQINKLLPELIKIFNENVEYGCCGGCI
ncbi:MAG: hypothetical protein IKP65_05375 [Alphaproteobacteria bacterium]|nr:hypothetical protein [Alphaproteobacteria bacterium]